MIRDIRPTDTPEVVVAHGQLYNLEKALDTTESLLMIFTGTVERLFKDAKAEIACRDLLDWAPFDGMGLMRMRTGFTLTKADKKGFDSGSFEYRVRVGPYKIHICLLGQYGLYRKPDGTLETIDGQVAEYYDPSPCIVISARVHPAGFMSVGDAEVVTASLASFFNAGIELGTMPAEREGTAPLVTFLRFSHEVFGSGEGEMRIECTDTE